MSVLQFSPPDHRLGQRSQRLFELNPRVLRAGGAHPALARCGYFRVFVLDTGTREHLALRIWADDAQQARTMAKSRLIEHGRRAAQLEVGIAVADVEQAKPIAPLATSILLILYWRLMWFGF
jgi:hypothetical protein